MGNKAKMYLDIMACHPEVTGSCFLGVLKLPNRETVKFVIDCGLFQEKEYDSLNNELPFDCDEISFVVVTHNHVDYRYCLKEAIMEKCIAQLRLKYYFH